MKSQMESKTKKNILSLGLNRLYPWNDQDSRRVRFEAWIMCSDFVVLTKLISNEAAEEGMFCIVAFQTVLIISHGNDAFDGHFKIFGGLRGDRKSVV